MAKNITTAFQRRLLNDMETLIGIIAITHPHLPTYRVAASFIATTEVKKKNKETGHRNKFSTLCAYYLHDWISITGRVRLEDGTTEQIDVCMENSWNTTLWGRISKESMERAYANGEVDFRIWTSPALDDATKRWEQIPREGEAKWKGFLDGMPNYLFKQYMLGRGYELQTQDEFWAIYWNDD